MNDNSNPIDINSDNNHNKDICIKNEHFEDTVTKEELLERINNLIEDNNQKNILIIQLQRHIRNLETALFSDSVPQSFSANASREKEKKAKAVKLPQLRYILPTPKNSKLKKILSRTLQKSILLGGKLIKNEAIQKKLKKLSKNPYAYFADSKCKFLRPLRNLFRQ